MKRLSGLLFLLLLLSGCGWMYQMGGDSSSSFDISKAEMKVPEFEFTNQEGVAYGTKQLEGTYWLADMIFTYCPSVCPTMTPNMQRLQATMQDEGVDMNFISFTVDPERDTPEHLKKYGVNVGADLNSWQFLTGYSLDEITQFAEDSFKTIVQHIEGSDDIMHSTSFFLIDPEGNIIRKYDGLQSDQKPIIADILKTVR
ncbi:SCO family protein [bacterium LRH843]|nr:SCO family protein [bacterium LRH843]